MVETHTSRKISNEQLLIDIANTAKELEAYQKIADGYRILAKLPENAGANATQHNFDADVYRSAEKRCAEFLKQLHALKAERGIT